MKVVTNLMGLLPLLSACVDASSRARTRATSDPIPQKHLVTAFTVKDDEPLVECWEVDAFLPNKGSSASAKKMGVAEGGLTGVEIMSWDKPGTVQPSASGDVHAQFVPIAFALVTVGTAMVIGQIAGVASEPALGDNKYVFDSSNGDDWFYFEDTTTGSYSDKQRCAVTEPTTPHFQADVLSNTGATIVQFKFDETPAHKVLYEGRCKFAGLVDAEAADAHVKRLRIQEM